MQQQRRARLAAAAAAAAIVLLVSLTILDIRNPLEAIGFIYHNVHPSVGYSRYASTAYPRSFIPRVALPLCPRTTDLHFPVDIGSDYSGGVGMQVIVDVARGAPAVVRPRALLHGELDLGAFAGLQGHGHFVLAGLAGRRDRRLRRRSGRRAARTDGPKSHSDAGRRRS